MTKRPWMITITHGNFGKALRESAEMILGELQDMYCLSLVEGMDPMELSEQLRELLEKAPENTIILTDLYGGTPSNVASIYAAEKEYTVLSGLNMTMLIEAEMARVNETYDNLGETIGESARDGIKNIRELMKERRKA